MKKADKEFIASHRCTFRTFIHELQQHTTLPQSFYAGFNAAGKRAAAVAAFKAHLAVPIEGTAPPDERARAKAKAKHATEDAGKLEKNSDDAIALEISQAVSGLSIDDPGSIDAVMSAYHLAGTMTSNSKRLAVHRSLRKHLQLTRVEEKSFIRESRQYTAPAEGEPETRELDFVETVLNRFLATTMSVIYSIGRYYRYYPDRHIWVAIDENTVAAAILEVIKTLPADVIDNGRNIDLLKKDVMERLRAERDGGRIYSQLEGIARQDDPQLPYISRLPTETTPIFTNYRNLQIASGDVHLYCNNAVVQLRTNGISNLVPDVDVRDSYAPKTPLRDLLLLPCDVANMKREGLVLVDEERDGYYVQSHRNVAYMPLKDVRRAVKRGAADRLLHFLDCISRSYKGKAKRDFITNYLDMLAYIMQPIKRHSVFYYVYGLGDNGKSFGIMILERICQPDEVVRQEVEAAANNPRFFASQLDGVHALVEDDLQEFKPGLLGILKRYANGNQLQNVEQKHSNERYAFLMTATFVLLSNRRINIQDTTKGLERRLHAMHFRDDISQEFTRREHGVPLLADDMDLVFNLLLMRIPRVVVSGPSRSETMIKAGRKLTRASNLQMLLTDLVASKRGRVTLAELYNHVMDKHMDLYGDFNMPTYTIDGMQQKVIELGFAIENGTILNAKLKETKKDG